MKAIIAASSAVAIAAAGIYHLGRIYNAIYPVPSQQISSYPRIPNSLLHSAAVKITNPHNHVPIHDTRFLTVHVSKSLTDEEILSRFVKGFFGGYVFKPERSLLEIARKEITNFEALHNTPVSSHIWSTAQFSAHELQPLHTLLFGTFRVVDLYIEPRATKQASKQTYSYIDFAFGSDKGYIAGVHRFSVSRNDPSREENEQDSDSTTSVTIEFAHAGCNPRENKPLKPDIIQSLHLLYAMLLFREGVAEVLKAQ